VSEAQDSLTFFEALFGDQPHRRILICEKTKGWSTHACLSPADAVHYVLGNVDVYHRATLVEHKPKRGRGTEADTSALTCLWSDVDVNGAPDGNGGVVSGAAASQADAVEVVHSVLEPTLIVSSGFGVQPYWKLAEPLLLHSEEERAAAKALLRGWHERLKRAAEEHGMSKLDSTFDLARVLRPVGSFNGKGEHPVPVTLLMDGGPVYALEQLQAEVVPVGEDPANTAGSGGDEPARSVEELIETFPKLGKITRREGKAPKDPSPSGWDHWLACESVRCGLSDGEIAALIRHGRAGDPKLDRDKYITGTIDTAREKVKVDESDPAHRISRRWGLLDDPIVAGATLGDVASGAARVYLERRSGSRLRLPRLGDLFESRKHTRIVSQVARSRFPALNTNDAASIAQAVIELCGGEDVDPLEEARQWVTEFIAYAGAVVDALDAQGKERTRWDVLCEHREAERRLPNTGNPAGRAAIIRKGSECWLPAGALKDYSGSGKSWDDFTTRPGGDWLAARGA
jgi:hypothetical protein